MALTLQQKRERLKAELAKVNSKLSAQERKDDTRRKILVGSFILGQKKNPVQELQGFAHYLKKDEDRALFGLEPLKKKEEGNQNV